MPISREVFEQLGDYSRLENLHVYGNLLNLYNLSVHGSIIEIERLANQLHRINHRIFTLYVSYILSRAGFNKGSIPIGELEFEPLYTTEFDEEDWIENIDLFEIDEEPAREDWSLIYEKECEEKIMITFLSLLVSKIGKENPLTGNCTEAAHLFSMYKRDFPHYYVVHPRFSRKATKTFHKTKEEMKELTGKDVVLSTGEFVSRFIPNKTKKRIVEINWENLRDRLLSNLQREWPILAFSIHEEELSDIEERLRKARLKYELGVDFEEVVKDSGIACEGLLRIIYSIYYGGLNERMSFSDMLNSLKDIIQSEYGDEIYYDLDHVRDWRNKVLHPPVKKPERSLVLRVLIKAELFYELFREKMKRAPQSK